MKKQKKKKTKIVWVDDGRTIYDMSGVERPHAFGSPSFSKDDKKVKKEQSNQKQKQSGGDLSRKEKWAAIKAAYAVYLPILLMVLLGFTIAFMLLALLMK